MMGDRYYKQGKKKEVRVENCSDDSAGTQAGMCDIHHGTAKEYTYWPFVAVTVEIRRFHSLSLNDDACPVLCATPSRLRPADFTSQMLSHLRQKNLSHSGWPDGIHQRQHACR